MPVCEEGELLKKANGLPHQCAHWFAMTEWPFAARETRLEKLARNDVNALCRIGANASHNLSDTDYN